MSDHLPGDLPGDDQHDPGQHDDVPGTGDAFDAEPLGGHDHPWDAETLDLDDHSSLPGVGDDVPDSGHHDGDGGDAPDLGDDQPAWFVDDHSDPGAHLPAVDDDTPDFGDDDGDPGPVDGLPGVDDHIDDGGLFDDHTAAFGADPDAAPSWDPDGVGDPVSGWLDLPDLNDVTVPEPSGGPPWVDTGLLGDDASGGDPAGVGDHLADTEQDAPPATPEGVVADLQHALGEPAGVGDPTTSDDPAVRNLARFWTAPS